MSDIGNSFGESPLFSFGTVDSTVHGEPAFATEAAEEGAANNRNLIRVHDAYGRELFLSRQQWRELVLPAHLAKVRDEPAALAAAILQALRYGFAADVVEVAGHLARTDANAERGAVVHAVVQRETGCLAEAERVLGDFVATHGPTGAVMTNLAKVQFARGQVEAGRDTLWRGLELDPNQDEGVGWYLSLHEEQGGEPAVREALQRLAALPGAWRARLWQAQTALHRRELDAALALYREAIDLAPRPVPADLLMQMGGDLGNAAHLPELLTLVVPHFDLELHGLQVAGNLIKAQLDLGRLDEARALLDRLYACRRPDWKPALDHWDRELAKACIATAPVPPEARVAFAMLQGDGPVWLPPESPAIELFPAATGTPVRIAFLGSSGETMAVGHAVTATPSDGPGRLSRALPLFLAEQVFFGGRTQVRPLMPWASGDTTAFVFCSAPWPEDEAAQQARLLDPPADYVVVTHLRVVADPWRVELRLVRTIDAKEVGRIESKFPMHEPEAALRKLASDLVELLREEAGVKPPEAPSPYQVPSGIAFPNYLLRLEQLLAVRCHAAEAGGAADLHGEREIIEGMLHLCLVQPGNLVLRLLLAETIRRLAKLVPQIVAEFREKIMLLQAEHPLKGPTQAVLKRLLGEVYPEP